MNKNIINFFDRKFYSSFENNWDNNLFRKKILSILQPTHLLLDVGAGAGYVKQMNFKEHAKEVYGVDMDPRVKENPALHHAVLADITQLSMFEDAKFDVIICNSVLEHIVNPERFVAEVSRVLKKGGYFMAKTPNRIHYVALVASLTTTSFHKRFLKKVGRPEEDTFPTFYKMNSTTKVRKLFSKNIFESVKIETIEGPPAYLRMNFIFYFFGWLYERTVNILHLDYFKMVIYITAKKS